MRRLRNHGLEESESKGPEVAKVNTGSWSTGRKEEISLEIGRNLKDLVIDFDFAILRAIKDLKE